MQPARIADAREEIKKINPAMIVVAAYAQIIPPEILAIPECGCVNIHASLLPKYRGAACIQAAIANGDEETGITVMRMDEKLDAGPVIAQKTIKIKPDDTAGSLFDGLSVLAAARTPDILRQYAAGGIKPRPQDNDKASYAKTLKKEDGRIDWQKPAPELERFVRAMSPWPGAFTFLPADSEGNMIMLKILAAEPQPLPVNRHAAGEIFARGRTLAVQCGRDALVLKSLQFAGKKTITAEEFLRGYRRFVGGKMGSGLLL